MDSEELYRKATMEEDLEYLRIEFEERAASLEFPPCYRRDGLYQCVERYYKT